MNDLSFSKLYLLHLCGVNGVELYAGGRFSGVSGHDFVVV